MKSTGLSIYGAATRLLAPLAPGLLQRRVDRGKEDPARLNERLGRPVVPRPEGALVWLHGASVGESLSLLPLATGLAARRPDLSFLFTSGTTTSAEMMLRRLPERSVHQYAPVDTPDAVAGFLDHWKPELGVFVESETWPNLILGAHARGVKLALVSARLSESSLRGWARFSGAARALFGAYDLVMAQDGPSGDRLLKLGARNDGLLNLKMAGEALPVDEGLLSETRALLADRPHFLAASTHPGEDEIILAAFASVQDRSERPLLVIAPRHPVRGAEIAALCQARGFACAQRSLDDAVTPQTEVLIADTLGELGLWFRVARLSLIAGSLVPGIGGHNPLEPARLGCPVLSGRQVDNWRSVYAELDAAGGVTWVADEAGLAALLSLALDRPEDFADKARAATLLAGGENGALDQACAALCALLEPVG